jgi:hypothetical protein
MWVSYKKGLLEKYSDSGKLLWSSSSSRDFQPGGITALAATGGRVWVGDQEGQLWVLDAGEMAEGWLRQSGLAQVAQLW